MATARTRKTQAPGDISDPQSSCWASADPLGQTLHSFRMDGVIYSQSRFTAPWGMDLPAMQGCPMFHVVTSGKATLLVEGADPVTLKPGEFALLPQGQGHAICSRRGAKLKHLFDLPRREIGPRYELIEYGGGGEETTLICGVVRFAHPAAQDLIQLLPSLIHIQADSSPQSDWMQSTLRLMAMEAATPQPGGETIITRLADILVMQSLRTWLQNNPLQTNTAEATGTNSNPRAGWLGAIQDDRIGPAIVKIHNAPTHDWTVESLANEVAMSRSAFSARFTELVGEPAMQFVTRWRMHQAGIWLREESMPIAECANKLGYNSEAAFNRAFKRVMNVTPGAWQKSVQSNAIA